MTYFIIKILVSAVLVALISEIGKRSGFWGAVLASLPLTSILAFVWLYKDTKDIEGISRLSMGIFWLVIPSLVLFIALPLLLKSGLSFYPSLLVAVALTVISYFAMSLILKSMGIQI